MPALPATARLRLPVLVLLVALLLSVSGAMIWGIRGFTASAGWVNHTHEVLRQIEAVRSAVRVSESSARGYRLTGQPGLHSEYLASRPRALVESSRLERLVNDNPAQERRARGLARTVVDRISEIDRIVHLYDLGRPEEATSAMGRGQRLMVEVDQIADDMREHEETLLTDRRLASERRAALLTGFVVAGMLLSLALITVLLWTLSRETTRARGLERATREAFDELQVSMTERERLGEQRRVLSAFAGLLHSCQSPEEAFDVAANALLQLVGHGSSVCYLMRSSQNLLEMRALFGTHGAGYVAVMRPDQCWGLRRGHTHVYDPSRPSAVCEHLRGLGEDAARGACVPLVTQGEVLGLLHVSTRLGAPLSEGELAAVESIGEHLAMVLHSLELRETLRVQSLRDPLTGLYNRRYLEESVPREMERCLRRTRPLSALMLDVDHFKRFNDEFGHGAGDALLGKVGEVLAACTRDEDIACRFGGEEFTVIMPEASLAAATDRAEEIRRRIGATVVNYMRRELGPVTVSIGVAQMAASEDTPQSLLACADRALYAAKAAGRDRVVCAPAAVRAASDGAPTPDT